ncbi:MAG: hypothetical protein KDA81_03580 [Planctomycetaceae bacterium]|nr:hypothetical protein [Planctomycetaceae bacterium]
MLKISDEQRAALQQSADGIVCEHPITQQTCFMVPAELYYRMMEALRQVNDLAAIRQGIADMESGRMMSVKEARLSTEEALKRIHRPQ